MVANVETMAFAGETPWHGLGVKIDDNLTPEEILTVAGLDWEVHRKPLFASQDDTGLQLQKMPDHSALVRASDNKVLGLCGSRFQVTQNHEAFKFFDKFCEGGHMAMHTAGSLDSGRWVWALAKVSDGFTLPGGDQVESYMLLANPHIWGESLKVMFTPIRVVCQNTLSMALQGFKSEHAFRMMHTRTFNNEQIFAQAEQALGLAMKQQAEHQEQAEFLAKAHVVNEQAQFQYFMKVLYPQAQQLVANDNLLYQELPLKVKNLLDLAVSSPGADMPSASDTYWGMYNAVTYWADHEAGRTDSGRLKSAWFGDNAHLKRRALTVALEQAKAA